MTIKTNPQSEKNRVQIFDTTLRDGEQSPGATMTLSEKIEIASLLDEMGVDIIEAGFPIASEGDFEAVTEIAKAAPNTVICGLARASFGDIDRCWEAVKNARKPRIHTFIGTSPLHREFQVQLDRDEMAQKSMTLLAMRATCVTMSNGRQWMPRAPKMTIWRAFAKSRLRLVRRQSIFLTPSVIQHHAKVPTLSVCC